MKLNLYNMKNNKITNKSLLARDAYKSPDLQVVEVLSEGVLCASTKEGELEFWQYESTDIW